MSHFRKITVDGVQYEYCVTYRSATSNVFIRSKKTRIHNSIPSEKVSEPERYCDDCRCDCGAENLPTRISVTPRDVAAYIRKQEFHTPLQSRTSPELIRLRPKKKKRSEMSLRELIQEIVNLEQREKFLKEKRRLQKKNKTAPKKKASSNGKEWAELARVNRGGKRFGF